MDLAKVKDIDTTFDEYVDHFKKQYLLDFPETLAIDQDTGVPVEEKTLVKYIKQFYRSKGTEKTFEFLFRIFYDTNVEFYYPKIDILKASDGKWIRNKSIKISGANGSVLFESSGRKIFQRNAANQVSSAASVLEVSKYQFGSFVVYELNLSNINGTFVATRPLEIETNGLNVTEPKVYSVVSTITISNGGSNYRVGDSVRFTNAAGDIGTGAKAYVDQINSSGKILKIVIEDFGINYNTAPTITVVSQKGTGFSGTCSIGAICNFEGYYANNDGRLSTNKVLQDNHYYQNYSYVLKSEVVINRYRDIIKRLIHPAGLGFFGQVLIKRCAQSNLDAESALIKYEVPIIGHYVPYTNETYDDLREWFGGTAAGYSPAVHDSILNVQPNPVTNSLSFPYAINPLKDIGFPGADPWWFIYQHPNRRIKDPVLARIEYDLKGLRGTNSVAEGKKDFLNNSNGTDSWNEWSLTGTSQRIAWANGFTSGYKYAILQYNNQSEFRKITLGSFFNMPIGEEFRCALEWESQITHDSSPNNLLPFTLCGLATSTTGGTGGITSGPIGATGGTGATGATGATTFDGGATGGFTGGELPDDYTRGVIVITPPAIIFGCTDRTALNYNPSATRDDGSCIPRILGCTDPTALNYNPIATVNDGSCIPIILGCNDPSAINYNSIATVNDGSCEYAILGCTDPLATNYNDSATVNDGTCTYPIYGCTDPEAGNYDPTATIDDGTCDNDPGGAIEYVLGCTDPAATNYNPSADRNDGSCTYETEVFGCMDPAATNYNPNATIDDGSCIDPPEPIYGCTDSSAENYNPEATIDNDTCCYEEGCDVGCTDPAARNYNPSATLDDGSCRYEPIRGCTDLAATNYNPDAEEDDGSCTYPPPPPPPTPDNVSPPQDYFP